MIVTQEKLDDVIHQRNVLMESIAQTGADLGLINPNMPLSGPQLLMVLGDITEYVKSLEARQKIYEDIVAIHDKTEAA